MQTIRLFLLVRVKKTSMLSSSRWLYCHSALSVRCKLYRDPVSSDIRSYVFSGGRNASLAAIRDGHGGQQKRQQSSLNDNPFIVSGWWSRGTSLAHKKKSKNDILYHRQQGSIRKSWNTNQLPGQIRGDRQWFNTLYVTCGTSSSRLPFYDVIRNKRQLNYCQAEFIICIITKHF